MAVYSDNLIDERTGRPIEGASLWVYDNVGAEATLTDALDQPLTQPLVTDADGAFEYKTADGVYRHDFWKNSVMIFRDNRVIVGTPATISASLGAFGVTLIGNATAADARSDLDVYSATQLAASSGSTLVKFDPGGANPNVRDLQAKLRDSMSLYDKQGTTANALGALNNVLTDFSAGGIVHLPKATWTLSATFTANVDRWNMKGDGRNVSLIAFNPASADVALEINKSGSGGSFQGSISSFGFTSSNSVEKTAIRLYNTADYEISDLAIPEGAWQGATSKGIHDLSRQSTYIRNVQFACARPYVASQNPEWTSLNGDHSVIEKVELTTTETSGSPIEFESGVCHSSRTIRNFALQKGKDGIKWDDTTSTAASFGINIDTGRIEQGTDATGYSIRWASTAQNTQTIKINNVYLDSARNGLYFRRVFKSTIDNAVFSMGAGKTAIDMTFVSGSFLHMRNCHQAGGATVTFTNARCVRRIDQTGISPLEEWIYEPTRAFSSGTQDYTDLTAVVEQGEKVWKIRDMLPTGTNTVLTPLINTGLRSSAYVELRTSAGAGTAGYGLFFIRPDGTIDTVQRAGNVNQAGGANTCRLLFGSGRIQLIGDTLGTAITYTLILRGDY